MTKFKLLNEETLKEGFDFLAKKEPGFKKVLVEKNYEINPFSKKDGFEGLISLIVEQQLSVASAHAIFGRMKILVKPFTPERFLSVNPKKFKEAGLSKQKIDYCSGIAKKIFDKELDLNNWFVFMMSKKDVSRMSVSHMFSFAGFNFLPFGPVVFWFILVLALFGRLRFRIFVFCC